MILDAPVDPPGDDGPTGPAPAGTVGAGPDDHAATVVLVQRCGWKRGSLGVVTGGVVALVLAAMVPA